MQIFVKDPLPTDQDATIYAAYQDHAWLPEDPHPGFTRIVIDRRYVKHVSDKALLTPLVLAKEWRADSGKLIDAEAERRIELYFPTAQMAAATLFLQTTMLTYGLDQNSWPGDARALVQKISDAQANIAAIRAAAANLHSTGPANPWHDSHWPSYPPVVLD